ncbi:hypothetical protein GVX82_04030 [Patescibacteria group bacterium]|jgi:hypothetical protein|nr:hypothetical protein [Patescibacteria group bacterium]
MDAPTAPLITSSRAARESGYTSDYINRLCRSGDIAARKEGGQWLVDQDSLSRFLFEQERRKRQRRVELARERRASYWRDRMRFVRLTLGGVLGLALLCLVALAMLNSGTQFAEHRDESVALVATADIRSQSLPAFVHDAIAHWLSMP